MLLTVATVALAVTYLACNLNTAQGSIIQPEIITGWKTDASGNTSFQFDRDQRVIKEETENDVTSYVFNNDSISITEFNKSENREVYSFNGKLDGNNRIIGGRSIATYISTSPDTIQHSFSYNSTGQLSEEKKSFSTKSEYRIRYTYKGGELTTVATYLNGVLYNSKEMTYYHGITGYGMQEQLKFHKNINNLVGKSNHSIVKDITSFGPKGDKKYKLRYAFENDRRGYPVKLISRKGKKIENTITFTYKSTFDDTNQSLTYVRAN